MLYSDYAAWLGIERAKITLEPGAVETGPLHSPTALPGVPPWKMDWLIRFPDGKQAYLYERWFPSKGLKRLGQRGAFSFHYGTSTTKVRQNGFPAREKINHPAIIRIDLDRHGPHLHFHGELPHIGQNKVAGMIIEQVDPFEFVRAVIKHRDCGEDFDTVMKFTVLP